MQQPQLDPEKPSWKPCWKAQRKKDEVQEYEAKSILTQLKMNDMSQKVGTCSGGQRRRVALACALIRPCDLLILDEPTNHLDQQMILWLEKRLIKSNKAMLMVTHDRYFLDRVTNAILEGGVGACLCLSDKLPGFLQLKAQREEMARPASANGWRICAKKPSGFSAGRWPARPRAGERIERFESSARSNGFRIPISLSSAP